MNLPSFFVIGAAKCGTTSLFDHPDQHPDIFFSELKEPRFFSHEGLEIHPTDPVSVQTVITWEGNCCLLEGAKRYGPVGEASGYLGSERVARGIAASLSDVKAHPPSPGPGGTGVVPLPMRPPGGAEPDDRAGGGFPGCLDH